MSKIEQTIGDRIRLARQAKRYSQEELAARCGISRQTVYEYEKNLYIPKLDNAGKLAEVLEVELDYICYGIREKRKTSCLTYEELMRAFLALQNSGLFEIEITKKEVLLKTKDKDVKDILTQMESLRNLSAGISDNTLDIVLEELLSSYQIAIIPTKE